MTEFSLGNPDSQATVGKQIDKEQSLSQTPPMTKDGGPDFFDRFVQNWNAGTVTTVIQVLKRALPVLTFLAASVWGVGVGQMAAVSGCLKGVYGEISMFFGLIKIPLYSTPSFCTAQDKFRDFLSIKPLVFIAAFVLVYFIWTYFDKKLVWRSRGDF